MRAWVEGDDRGREYLVRTGTGVVTAVVPVGLVGTDDRHTFYRVEIHCDAPLGRPGAIRFSSHPLVLAEDALFSTAVDSLREAWSIAWTVEWHRHDWIPGDLPIGSLNLVTDARCGLVALDRVAAPEAVDDAAPAFVPARWTAACHLEDGVE